MENNFGKVIAFILGIVLGVNVVAYIFNNLGSWPALSVGIAFTITLMFMFIKEFRNLFGFLLILTIAASMQSCACERVPPNYEGVLIQDCGQDGMEDFKLVKGRVNTMGYCTELVKVPMFEQKGDIPKINVTTNDGGVFTVDPNYAYQPIRNKAKEIAFHYQQYKGDEGSFLDNIETNILNPRIVNVYIETARLFDTDSLMRNMSLYEKTVEQRLGMDFENAYFKLVSVTSNLVPPASMREAIERRNKVTLQAEENRLAIEREKAQLDIELQKAQMEVEIAKLEAQANLERAKGLTPPVLREMQIKGWVKAGCPMPQVLGDEAFVMPVVKQ